MKRPSSRSDGLLGPLFSSPAVEQQLSDESLLRAMLQAEAALASASAKRGVVPADAAALIQEVCEHGEFDVEELGANGETAGNPVVPLVRSLVRQVPDAARPWVHFGATSQDIFDTAVMLIAQSAGRLVLVDLATVVAELASLTAAHRRTVMLGRTLGQQAVVTTFGMKSAGWLVAVDAARSALAASLETDLAAQLGGAAGTMGVFGAAGPEVLREFAGQTGLAEPVVPWHTDRQRILRFAAALSEVVAAVGKLALDVELLAQTEIGEVYEGGDASHGSSSAMPHKRNPVDAVLIRAAAYQSPGLVATLFAASQHELERAAGAWHAEWAPLLELERVTGGAVARAVRLARALEVDAARMRENLDSTGGLVMAEQLTALLAPALGRSRASDVVARCCEHARRSGRQLRDVVLADDDVRSHLSAAQIDESLDPQGALHAIDGLIDRALAHCVPTSLSGGDA